MVFCKWLKYILKELKSTARVGVRLMKVLLKVSRCEKRHKEKLSLKHVNSLISLLLLIPIPGEVAHPQVSFKLLIMPRLLGKICCNLNELLSIINRFPYRTRFLPVQVLPDRTKPYFRQKHEVLLHLIFTACPENVLHFKKCSKYRNLSEHFRRKTNLHIHLHSAHLFFMVRKTFTANENCIPAKLTNFPQILMCSFFYTRNRLFKFS